MNLWIRSQDKLELMKINDIYIFESEVDGHHFEIKGIANDSGSEVLGRYETQERALEVLDEIQNKLLDNVIATNEDGYATLLENTCFYQMPKE